MNLPMHKLLMTALVGLLTFIVGCSDTETYSIAKLEVDRRDDDSEEEWLQFQQGLAVVATDRATLRSALGELPDLSFIPISRRSTADVWLKSKTTARLRETGIIEIRVSFPDAPAHPPELARFIALAVVNKYDEQDRFQQAQRHDELREELRIIDELLKQLRSTTSGDTDAEVAAEYQRNRVKMQRAIDDLEVSIRTPSRVRLFSEY